MTQVPLRTSRKSAAFRYLGLALWAVSFYEHLAAAKYHFLTMSGIVHYQSTRMVTGNRAPGPEQRQNDLHDLERLWSAILRRRKLFVTIVAGFVAAVVAVTLLTPKSYKTTVSLMAGNPSTTAPANDRDTALPILNALVLQSGEQSAETFAALAQQEDIAAGVARQLNLNVSAGSLLERVTVKPVPNTALLNLSVSWKSPQMSASIANSFADQFIARERDFVRSQATAAIGFLQGEIPKAQQNMQDAAAELARFQGAHGFVNAETHTQDIAARSTALDGKLQSLVLDRGEAQALLQNVRAQLARIPDTVDNAKQIAVNPVLTDLETKLAATELQLRTAEEQYTDQHPAVVALRRQRADLQAQINRLPREITSGNTLSPNPLYQSLSQEAAQYSARVDGDSAQIREVNRERAALFPVMRSLPQQSMQFAQLQQRAKMTADVYNALQQKFNDATIARTTAISDISIIQAANSDSAVKSPNLRVNIAVALIVGLLLAGTIVFILDYLERTIRNAGDVRMALGLPVIASIPEFKSSNTRALPWLQSMTIEAFLHLCVALRLSKKRPLKTVAITSPSQGEGKSTIAFNLAKAMAQVQPRVLLVDGDLRRATLHELADCKNDYGLSEVLRGDRSLDSSVREIAPNLDLLTSGRAGDTPTVLLQSANLDDMLRSASEAYAMVIIDTPPVTYVPDALSICSKVDGTAFVIAVDSTNQHAAQQIVVQFESLGIENILGVILNRDRARFHDYSDYFATSFRPALPGEQ